MYVYCKICGNRDHQKNMRNYIFYKHTFLCAKSSWIKLIICNMTSEEKEEFKDLLFYESFEKDSEHSFKKDTNKPTNKH